MNLEQHIINYASPTLAGIKTASLFTFKFLSENNLNEQIAKMNCIFKEKGVLIKVLKATQNTALVYVFRENMLVYDMSDKKACTILNKYGYKGLGVQASINKLIKRLNFFDEFPHEIGLFLGYPPEDVEGFICHKGKYCNLCGYWKVYGNTDEALRKFAKYDKCKAVYKKLWQEGKNILQLTVNKQNVA